MRNQRTWVRAWVVATSMLAVSGCSGDRVESSTGASTFPGTASNSGTATAGDTGDESATGTMDSADTGGLKLDIGAATSGAVDTGSECAEVSEMAMVGKQPADIIVVIDNSGSMQFEANAVKQNMNSFSSQIFLANIEAHVVLISAYPDDDAGVCIEPPLGSGGCPTDDNNPPTFTHIGDGVGSNNALEKIIQHWDSYKDVLRPTAAKHIIVVSDDDSDMSAATFTAMWTALDPNNADFTFHGIVAPEDPILACLSQTSCCAISAAVGQEYMTLINQTGGVFGNLCDQQFQPIFDAVATQVVNEAEIACEFTIPEPPDGMAFDKDKVNVEFDTGIGATLEIGRVDNPAECANVTDGWYYDDYDDPTTILLCPQTCDKIQGYENASISVKFNCPTIPAG